MISLKALWQQVEFGGTSKEPQRLFLASHSMDVPSVLEPTSCVRKSFPHYPRSHPFHKTSSGFPLPLGTWSSYYHFCFLWRKTIRAQSPFWVEERAGRGSIMVGQGEEDCIGILDGVQNPPLSFANTYLFFLQNRFPFLYIKLHSL